jgi:hypothetical protein
MEALAGLSRDNPMTVLEQRVINADGEIRWQQWTNQVLFDDQGRILEHQAVGRDITAQRQAEEALRAQKNLLHTVFSATPDLLVLKDRDLVYRREPGFLPFLGRRPKRSWADRLRTVSPGKPRNTGGTTSGAGEGAALVLDEEVTAPAEEMAAVIKTPVIDVPGTPADSLLGHRYQLRKRAEED